MSASPAARRRVLVVAYECNPNRGSESGAGFSLLTAIAARADCTVLVGSRDGAELAAWAERESGGRVEVVQPGESRFGRYLFRVHRYPRFLAYLLWLRHITPALRRLTANGDFDAAWHLTYSPFWLPTPLRHLDSTPTIWGPVTGGDSTPPQLRSMLGGSARLFEALDIAATEVLRRFPSVRASHRAVDLVLTSLDRPEVRSMRGRRAVWLFPQSLMARVDESAAATAPTAIEDALYFVSPLRAQKGPHLALRAAALDERIRLVFAPPPDPEAVGRFKELVTEMGMDERVSFVEIDRAEMHRRQRASKGVVHTATNDSSSMALSEPLALGVPIVGLDVLGTREVCAHVTDRRHVRLAPLGEPDAVIRDLSRLMVEAMAEPHPPTRPLIDQDALGDRLASAIDQAVIEHAGTGDRKKIVQVFYALQDRGGEAVASSLADGFRERGHETINIGVFRASPANSATEDFEILYRGRPAMLANLRCAVDLWRRFRRIKPDVVVLHTDAAQLLGAPGAWAAGVKHRISVHHLALGTYVKAFRYLHACYARVGLYTRVVFVGESAHRDALRLPRAFQRRMQLINNAVTVKLGDRRSARQRFGIPEDAFVFLNVGSCTRQKNQETLLAAMGHVGGGLLVIAGSGEREAELRREAEPFGDRVRFLGRLSPDAMGDVYALADVFVFPSRYEGRPLALLEAVAAELPIIASDIPENREVTLDAVAYAPPENAAAWAALMGQALDEPHFVDDIRRRVKALDLGTASSMVDDYVRLMR